MPEVPDVLGHLGAQAAVTTEAMDALVAWAQGDRDAADLVRRLERRADERKRRLRSALTELFAPPLDPEDLFTLSEGLDAVVDHARDTVREAELMRVDPDAAMADMAAALAAGTRRLEAAFAALPAAGSAAAATGAADEALRCRRDVEAVYGRAMSALLGVDDLAAVTARRELYRRMVRTGDDVAGVAERVWYAVLKQT